MERGVPVTISLCMIVKNEEAILARCLDSIADLMDEIIIVDTGSTDRTKEIAKKYTDKIFDFVWINDFSAARNFAFSKATMDYIYSADADEVLEGENRELFRILKENLLPEIDIVQMKYGNQLSFGTVYNFDEEYRPKLFKRLREFVWEAPIHEQVRLTPLVYDSDIVISHKPVSSHSGRDLATFRKAIAGGYVLPDRLLDMYARELYMNGTLEDYEGARDYFLSLLEEGSVNEEQMTKCCLILAVYAKMVKDIPLFFKYIMKIIAGFQCSEGCLELGNYYQEREDYQEALVWFYNAAYETEPILKLTAGNKEPLEHLIDCCQKLGLSEEAEEYKKRLESI